MRRGRHSWVGGCGSRRRPGEERHGRGRGCRGHGSQGKRGALVARAKRNQSSCGVGGHRLTVRRKRLKERERLTPMS